MSRTLSGCKSCRRECVSREEARRGQEPQEKQCNVKVGIVAGYPLTKNTHTNARTRQRHANCQRRQPSPTTTTQHREMTCAASPGNNHLLVSREREIHSTERALAHGLGPARDVELVERPAMVDDSLDETKPLEN